MSDSKKAQKPTLSAAAIGEQMKKRPFIPAVLILALFGLVFLGMQIWGWYVVATVNNEPITRFEYIDQLESAAGQQVLDGMITEKLISQKAAEEGIAVSSEEVTSRLDELAAQFGQGQSIDQLLEMEGLERSDIEDQVRLEIQLERLAAQEINVASEEVDAFIEQNDQLAAEDTDIETLRDQARTQLEEQKRGQQIQQYLQTIRQNAQIERNTE